MAVGDQAAAAVAALELTVLAVEVTRATAAEKKRYHLAVGLDGRPILKLRADRIPRFTYFPLRKENLENAAPVIRIDLFYSPRIPLRRRRLKGSGALPVSSSRIAAGNTAVSIRGADGVLLGIVTVLARIFWDLGRTNMSRSSPSMREEGGRPTAAPLPGEGDLTGPGDWSSWLRIVAGASAVAAAVVAGFALRRRA